VSRLAGRAGDVAARIEHTLLDPLAGPAAVARWCDEALEHGFAAVCVNPIWVRMCAERLGGGRVRVCSVAGFPLGAGLTEVRALEARRAVEHGAQEVDAVIGLGALRSGDHDGVRRDLEAIVAAARPAAVKAILETGSLSGAETVAAARIAVEAGAAFVKTSTGFGATGATVETVALLRQVVGPDVGVKASGGIRTLGQALALIEAGACRLGTSAGVEIVRAGSAGA
jgi:deoxyribose-phosphate aldolase